MNEAVELRKVLLRLAEDYESGEPPWTTLRCDTDEEQRWLLRTFANLKSEGSALQLPGIQAYKFSPIGYQRYLPQITAWRSNENPPRKLANADLDTSLLYRIMRELGNLRSLPASRISTRTFEHLLVKIGELDRFDVWPRYLNRHLDYLEETGFVRFQARLGDEDRAGISLTARGQIFVQPELAEFGQRPILPEVVKSIEEQIHALTDPPAEKEGLIFRLREAVSKQAPDFIAKVLVEVSARILTGGH